MVCFSGHPGIIIFFLIYYKIILYKCMYIYISAVHRLKINIRRTHWFFRTIFYFLSTKPWKNAHHSTLIMLYLLARSHNYVQIMFDMLWYVSRPCSRGSCELVSGHHPNTYIIITRNTNKNDYNIINGIGRVKRVNNVTILYELYFNAISKRARTKWDEHGVYSRVIILL